MSVLSHCMLFGAAFCVLSDLSSEKIPNILCASLLGTSAVMRALAPPAALLLENAPLPSVGGSFLSGSLSWLCGAAVPLLLFPAFRFRLIGAGDIKLLMALGSFLTPSRSLNLLFLSFLAGAVLSVFRLFLLHFRAGRTPPSAPGPALRSVHFSVPVFAAAVLMTGGDLLCAS